MPQRYKLSRKRGYKKPQHVVSVVRPGRWGNPFNSAAKFEAVLEYVTARPYAGLDELHQDIPWTADECTAADIDRMKRIARDIGQLRFKDLACYCDLDAKCHADVLIRFANR